MRTIKKFLLLAMLIATPLFAQKSTYLDAPTNSFGLFIAGSSVTYAAGSLTLQGVAQTINAGTLTSFAASKSDCSPASIKAGTDLCEYVFATSGSTSFQHTTTLVDALPYVEAVVTTDGSGNPLTVQAWTPPLPAGFFESSSPGGFINNAVAVSPSATPVFNPNLGSILYLLINQNVTSSTIKDAPVGKWVYLSIVQPNTGGPFSMTWPANMHWPAGTVALGLSTSGGSPLVISTTANSASGAKCYYAGAPGWYCTETFWGLH